MSNCNLFTRLEISLFDKLNQIDDFDKVPNQPCPICSTSLTQMSKFETCCDPYSRILKCGHWVHVNCQLDHNPFLNRCSVCKQVLIGKDKLVKICRGYNRFKSTRPNFHEIDSHMDRNPDHLEN